ncbi:uncharacterized protein N7483_011499 [Penicillium malachiteum]|uniref:uncharacterized protein n=1 Tax=Penicillium malachiteum TaxID=1324776 RepID=UPI0025480A99|nr:uncharacterized protein N7483_011499 [Penicillium malachiteum]KAJ5714318.1 hypothetical protein N7483_011499 [Penicillium malachiteum]
MGALGKESVSSPERPKKFLVQPIETSSRSSKPSSTSADTANKVTSTSSSTPSLENENGDRLGDQPRRRILPQPIETSTTSRHGPSRPQEQPQNPALVTSSPRRFKPDLIATDYRSVKGKDMNDSHGFNTQEIPLEKSNLDSRLNVRRNTFPYLSDSPFSYTNLLRRQEVRRHSFRVPDLPSIPSNSSEGSDGTPGSPLTSSSQTKQLLENFFDKPDTPMRGAYDGELSEYLSSLAARSEQWQLKEQTLAAFPNEQVYEPVDHFAADEEDGDSEDQKSLYPRATDHLKSRRQSSADLSWELEYMRQHKEEAEQRLRAMGTSRAKRRLLHHQPSNPKPLGPSPPMLGGDIVLPWSDSPEGTLSENTGTDKREPTSEDRCTDCGGLWCAATEGDGGRGAGLWMGTCQKNGDSEQESHFFSGIMTPMMRDDESDSGPNVQVTPEPSSPTMKDPIGLGLSTGPSLSKTISDEFNDTFVTQIYNYLSLGYPCVARDYDQELSRISGIPVDDLRRDDQHTNARGYVVAPEEDRTVEACTRWKALRLYIREWARQQPNMAEEETGLESWGMRERRGSWAI